MCICTVKARRKAGSYPSDASSNAAAARFSSIMPIVSGLSTVLILSLILGLIYTQCYHNNSYCDFKYCSDYKYRFRCYKYRTYVGSTTCTSGVTSATGYCYSFKCSYYEYDDICYRYRQNITSSGNCTGVTSADNNYCYTFCPHDMYTYRGYCYGDKKYVGSSGRCTGVRYSGYCYYTVCPFYEHLDSCYIYRQYVGSSDECNYTGTKPSGGYCYYDYCPGYLYRDLCYENKDYVGSTGRCNGVRSSIGYCYYDRYY